MIAFSIAAPISWWASQKWLEDYAYTINLNGWYFAGAGLLTLIVAVLTVSSKTIQAVVQNPVIIPSFRRIKSCKSRNHVKKLF